ncbi:MAG TPA: twin-arginine translocase subunit TatC [Polyangiaceae bacterium]
MTDRDSKAPGQEDPDRHQMTIWEHLDELRSRIVKMLIAFLLGAILAWTYKEELLALLTEPFLKAGGKDLGFMAPAAAFMAYVRLSVIAGVVFALPIMLWQIWAFVAPGLYSREKRLAIPFVVSSCGLFAAGGYFGWKVAFPVAFKFLLSFEGPLKNKIEVKANVMVPEYLEFVQNMLLAFGLMAELPVLVFFLSVAGLVNHKHLIKFFRYFIVIAFVIAAVVTPPDPLSQLLLAVPLVLLYGVSIGVAFVFARKPKAAEADRDDDDKREPPSKAAE